jgi:hypothetical protein
LGLSAGAAAGAAMGETSNHAAWQKKKFVVSKGTKVRVTGACVQQQHASFQSLIFTR